jgi:uncharacterized membrane protein
LEFLPPLTEYPERGKIRHYTPHIGRKGKMRKNPHLVRGIQGIFKETGAEKYPLVFSLFAIYLSALVFAYLGHKLFSVYFSVSELFSGTASVEYPWLMLGLLVFFMCVFTVILAFDKKRVSVIVHHVVSLVMLTYFFVRAASGLWPEYDNPLYVVAACLLISIYAGYLFEKIFPAVKAYKGLVEAKAVFICAAVCLLYFLYFAWLGLERHALFYTQMYDMSWENQALYNLSHFGIPYSTIESAAGTINWGDHASLIYYALAPFYLVFPRPEFLIVVQALFVSVSGLLLFLFAKRVLKSAPAALVIVFVFLLHPSVQGWLLQDFHPNVLALPLFFAFLIFVEKKNFPAALGFFIALALVREDLAFFSFFAGLYVMAIKRAPGPLKGLAFPAAAAVIALLMLLLMKSSGGGLVDMKRFYTMSDSFTGVIQQVIINPVYIISQAFEQDKISFIAVISAPLLFLFYRQPAAWIMLVPAFIFGIFSRYQPHYLLGYHYTVIFVCAAFTGFIYYFAEKKKPFTPFIAGIMIALALLLNYFYGNVFSKSYRLVSAELQLAPEPPDYNLKGWTGMYSSLKGEKDAEAVKIAGLIPAKYKVSADYFFSAHVSGRRYIYQLSLSNEADVIVVRKGAAGYAGFTLLKVTKRWAFYVKDHIIIEKHAGLNADGSVFFIKTN